MTRRRVRSVVRALALLLIIAGVVRATGWHEPPRFDGAGYATLGQSLAQGRGYREISHPDAPPHAHFPPAYPATLALVWLAVGGEDRASFTVVAHGLSVVLTVLGFLAVAAWWRRVEPPDVALPMTLALALNWQWHRNGGVIRSEPLALALSGAALLLARRVGNPRGGGMSLVGLSLVLAAAILTRQVLVCLAGAVVLDLVIRRGWRWGLIVGLGVATLVAPWVVWQRAIRSAGQLGLFGGSDLPGLVASQALFYTRRLPDAVSGPFVEVATVFTRLRWLGPVASVGAIAVAGVELLGWISLARSPRRRLGVTIPLMTFPLLLVWPFTEAGRFLVPLVPFVLLGLTEGGGSILARVGIGRKRGRVVAAWLLVAGAMPYAVYALIADRAGAERRVQDGFDAACRGLADPSRRPGPIMARHAADAAWVSGRFAVPIPEGGPDRVAAEIERWDVVYLVVDADRYAESPDNPLRAYVADPTRARRISLAGAAGTAVYEVIRPASGR